ncbi:MBL fold metallo-hydrolase, partial [archaeon]|nr:MBL fold metallo-hydrolase [archaeon]
MIMMLNIIKSASAIIRKSTGEVYLGLRSKNLRTFPNFWVFPGGKIDEHLNENWMGTEKEVINTIIRELYEEIGLVFGYDKIFEANDRERDIDEIPYDMQLRSKLIKNMSYIGKKDTPPFTKNVYSAAYYYIKSEIFDNIDPIVDGQELVEGQWIMPKTAIKHWIEGKILLPPPILHLLKKIDDENFVNISREETFLPVGFQTKIEIYPDIQIIPIASSTIKPFFNTNLIVIEGKNNYILIDPGANDKGKEHLKLILKNLKKIPIIFLTHHHYDHWEGVDIIEEFYPNTIIYAHENTNSKIK